MQQPLSAENTEQQVVIAQLQRNATTLSHNNKRRRNDSEGSNVFYSGAEDNDIETLTKTVNTRFEQIEKQQSETNNTLQQIFQKLTSLNTRQVNAPQQQPRGRSTSRKPAVPKNQPVNNALKMTYASALTSASTAPALIRNITITADAEKFPSVKESLLTNTAVAGNGIVAVKQKGKGNFTVFFANEEGAKRTEEHLNRFYDKDVFVKKVNQIMPMVKITRIFSIYEQVADIITELRKQNEWMSELEFRCVRSYTVDTAFGTYVNVILACNLATQEIFLKKGACIFGLNSCKIFEYIDVLRCNKCQRFGHFAKECTFAEICRNCHKGHATSTCNDEHVNKCSNCIAENKKGAQHNSRHRTSDERCPIRLERINALKKFYLSQSALTKK